jgi:putative ABC transport system permease protein
MAACAILAMAAVLAPLLVLAGLREGVITGLRETLLQDPHAREILSASNRDISTAALSAIAARPDVAFLVPRTRTLSASLPVEKLGGVQSRIELIATAPGDPLLDGPGPTADHDIVLSTAAAARLGADQGDDLIGHLTRLTRAGERQIVELQLHVLAIAPASAFPREGAFVTLPFATYVEDFQDGVASIPSDAGLRQGGLRQNYAGFRLYARTLEQVPGLDNALRRQGLDVSSRAAAVAGLLQLDRNLTLLFWLVAGLGASGYLVSLGASLWAGVERKRAALAMLSFLGVPRRTLALFPTLQATGLGLASSVLAALAAYGVAFLVNHAFAGTLELDRALCRISPGIVMGAVALTLVGAGVASMAASWRVGKVEPWEGMH